MKRLVALMSAVVLSVGLNSALAWTAPSDDQIAAVLADHSQLDVLIAGANPNQVATVLSRSLAQVDASSLSADGKAQISALIYTRAFLLSGENAPQMVSSAASQMDDKVVPALAAATAVAMGSNSGPVFDSLVQAAGGAGSAGGNAVVAAAQDPTTALSGDSLALVQQLVIELRGVAAAVIPPPSTAPLKLVPPIVPQGTTQASPPPVASTYSGQ